jgi:hypothetical protein
LLPGTKKVPRLKKDFIVMYSERIFGAAGAKIAVRSEKDFIVMYS